MSKEDAKAFEAKLKLIEKTYESIDENKKSISKLNGAIACLQEERHDSRRPYLPTYEMAFDKELKRLTDKYDEDHTPEKVYMPDHLIWWFVFLTLPFALACFSYFVDQKETITREGMYIFVPFGIAAVIPVIVFFVSLYLIISHKGRVKRYFKRNRKRLKAIESFKPDAEKVAQKAKAEADRKYAEYQRGLAENQKIDAQIERYCQQKAELNKTIRDDTAIIKALFDELQTPEGFRNANYLIAIQAHFYIDKEAIVAGKMTAMESLQASYQSLRKTEEDYEIEQLARRHAAREQAKINAERSRHQAEIRAREEAKREKEERERREREEEAKRKRWKELDDWADIVNNQ